MLRSRLALACAALLALAVAAPAAADHTDFHPELRTERTFFHCAGEVKAQNVAFANGDVPSWDATPPSGSVQDGEGCGYYDPVPTGFLQVADATWQGTFTGNLDTLTVELHRLVPQPGVTQPNTVVVALTIDDEVRVRTEDGVALQFTPSDTGASESATFSATDLGYLTEDGFGDTERTIELRIASFGLDTQSLWVFDTTEVPAGIEFNPEVLSETVVAAS